jgi:hypothetical protein
MYCAAAGWASKKAAAASRDKPNNNDLRDAGPFAAPFMLGFPSRAAIRLLRQIRPKTLNNIPCRRMLCNILPRSAGARGCMRPN